MAVTTKYSLTVLSVVRVWVMLFRILTFRRDSVLVDLDPDDRPWPLRPVMGMFVFVMIKVAVAETPSAFPLLLLAFMTLTVFVGVATWPTWVCTVCMVVVTLLIALFCICTVTSSLLTRVGAVVLLNSVLNVVLVLVGARGCAVVSLTSGWTLAGAVATLWFLRGRNSVLGNRGLRCVCAWIGRPWGGIVCF